MIELVGWISILFLFFVFLIRAHQTIEKANIKLLQTQKLKWIEIENNYAKKN